MKTLTAKSRIIKGGNGTPLVPAEVNRHAKAFIEQGAAIDSDSVTIPRLETALMRLNIVGVSPLICHAWSAKAIRMMLDKQMGKPSAGKEPKDPFADFAGTLYPLPDGKGWGFPAPAFKACAVSAANDVEVKMTEAKRALQVLWYTVPINAPPLAKEHWTDWDHEYEKQLEPYHAAGIGMRMDLVRLENGVADIRFRGWFPVWGCTLEIEYNSRVMSRAKVVNIINVGGYGVGVGEWRPGAPECRSGVYGRFTVDKKIV